MEILQVYVPTITNLEGVGQQLNLDSIVTKFDNQKYRLILLLIIALLLILYYKIYQNHISKPTLGYKNLLKKDLMQQKMFSFYIGKKYQ